MKFVNKNHALERSQKFHDLHSRNDDRNENILISDYHLRIYYWQDKHKVIMPKKLRKKYYQKYVFEKSQ